MRLSMDMSLCKPMQGGPSDVPTSFWEPTSWVWWDGRTEVTKTLAMTGADADVANVLFCCWFSPEEVSTVLGVFTCVENASGLDGGGLAPLTINRVAANLPYNRFTHKGGGGTVFTTSTVYQNANPPVNANRYFLASYVDHNTSPGTGTIAIFSGTSWEVASGPVGYAYAFGALDFGLVEPLRIAGHNNLSTARWYGRMSHVYLKTNITDIDLTVAATRNALLVDPGAAGAGYGFGTPDIFFGASAADYNIGTNAGSGGTFNSIVDGLVVNYPYTQARVTTAGATNLTVTSATGLDNPLTAFTFSGWFTATVTTQIVLFSLAGGSGNFSLSKQASGNGNKLFFSQSDSIGSAVTTADGPTGPSNRSSFAVNTGALFHVYICGSVTGPDLVEGYINGTLAFTYAPVVDGGMVDFGTNTNFRIGTNSGGTAMWSGTMGDIWFADTYLPAATYLSTFYNGGVPPILYGRKHAVGGVQPLVMEGQGMALSHWNASKLLGSSTGGTTLTGTFA